MKSCWLSLASHVLTLSMLVFFGLGSRATSPVRAQPVAPPATLPVTLPVTPAIDPDPNASAGPHVTPADGSDSLQAVKTLADPIPVPTLAPRPQDRIIARNFARILQISHLEHPKIDDEISRRTFKLLFELLDPSKLYFNQSDIDEFSRYETDFDDIVKSGDLTVPFAIYNRFLLRIDERMKTVAQLLEMRHDFTVDEEMVKDKKLLTYPKTEAEAFDRWRKRIKFEILVLKGEARDKAKEREKAAASNEEPAKVAKEDAEDPILRLRRRYNGFRKRMLQVNGKGASNNDEVLEVFLTSVGTALDPHSTYMSPSTYENFLISIGLRLQGIGATLTSVDGYTVIKNLVKGGAAQKSGLIKGEDKIIAVGQGKEGPMEDIVDWKLNDVVSRIRGEAGTIVRLEILPDDGGARKTVEITREVIKLEDSAAKGEVFEVGNKGDGTPYKIGIVNLPSFYFDMDAARRGDPNAKSTTTDVRRILKDFVAQDVDAVVLDLQYNGGGSLQEAVSLTGLFIETGNVVQTKDQMPNMPPRIRALNDLDPGVDWTGPLVVMVSKFSASASEIFAGAIRDYQRGLIVGDSRTHGKGSVQQMKVLGEELGLIDNSSYGALKLTIQGYYLPGGESPQLKGVVSDVVLPSLNDVIEDICEEDLDYALKFEKIPAAGQFPVFQYVTAKLDKVLQSESDARTSKNTEFDALKRDIALYKEMKAKKTITLNEEKYFAELDRLNADKKEKEKYEKMAESEDKIKRDFYLDEVMNIAVDYMNELRKEGVAFPKERSKAPKRTFFSDLFGP